MAHRQKVSALVLERKHSGEADRLVTFFTRELGVVKAFAKGVRRIPSSRGGHLEPYTRVFTLLSHTRAGTYIAAVQTEEYFPALMADTNALLFARSISYVLKNTFAELEPHERMYNAVLQSWRVLPQLPPGKRSLLEAALVFSALREVGLLPDFQSCMQCRRSSVSDAAVLGSHGWSCVSCIPSLQDAQHSVSAKALKVIRYIAHRPTDALRVRVEPQEAMQITHALRHVLPKVVEQGAAI